MLNDKYYLVRLIVIKNINKLNNIKEIKRGHLTEKMPSFVYFFRLLRK